MLITSKLFLILILTHISSHLLCRYCTENCKSYCDQPDRNDGLSGSVSSAGGETGILGTYTVVKGEDKPPSIKIPGLDFSSDEGKKLIGY